MYIMKNNVIGEKMIDLSYPIKGKDIAVIRMLSDNVQYQIQQILKLLSVMDPISDTKR